MQQCYRVASGPDFVLIVFVPDVAAYHAFAHRVLTAQANVRNVRSFFAVKRSKFEPAGSAVAAQARRLDCRKA